ncbi:hypothetical protein NEF87_001815 [Candidatus Lokiarchaeum ossiferum]|uniref:Uncharacterized protein n=1 Tax=Candidatus Lokiarchaeum ossiferum TaxID=2951803 RepID=A0ABY6HQ46_9ARCH|nr:hypothetical protein NEF87_001815 [Candidatus Lokiarchaeum sp. B-35]
MSERTGTNNNRFWKKRLNKRTRKKDHEKFHASIDKDTSLTLYRREGGLYLIIKKELVEYDLTIKPSEAPVINQYLKVPDPFESMLADIKIFENEIEPLNLGVQTTFGESKDINLISVKLAIGSGEDDYVTIDESDLFAMDVEPTMTGLLDFIQANDSIIGICDRIFDHEKGNIVLLEAKLRDPHIGISSIEFKILSSLHQRGLYLQKNMRYAGLQLYTIIKAESLTPELLSYLKAIDIDWEIVFLRRDLAIGDWLEVECEKSSISLKGYLASKYESLGFFDVNNITRIAIVNQLSFKIVVRMSELLNRVKFNKEELTGGSPDQDPLKKAEIIAAANLACAYHGIKVDIKIDKEIDPLEIQRFEEELIRL